MLYQALLASHPCLSPVCWVLMWLHTHALPGSVSIASMLESSVLSVACGFTHLLYQALLASHPCLSPVCWWWLHTECLGLLDKDYVNLRSSDLDWRCSPCHRAALPFLHSSPLAPWAPKLSLSKCPIRAPPMMQVLHYSVEKLAKNKNK